MKKYLIKEIYNDDNSFYYDMLIDDLTLNFNDLIFIGGNRDLSMVNYDIINTLIDRLYNYSDYEIEYYYNNHYVNYIIDILKPFKKLSLKQAIKIMVLCKDNRIEKTAFILEALQVIYNRRYEKTTLQGYCQGDFIYCYYALDDINHDYIKYIEAVFFNTGVEVFISDNKIDDSNINIDDIEINIDGSYDYIVNGFIDDKKSAAAGFLGCSVDEINYYEIKDIKTVTSYKVTYNNY